MESGGVGGVCWYAVKGDAQSSKLLTMEKKDLPVHLQVLFWKSANKIYDGL